MPFYAWHGIDIVGDDHNGVLFARNELALDALLFKQGIALLDARVKVPLFKREQKVSYNVLAEFCTEMVHLLSADVPLDLALSLTSKTIRDELLRPIIIDVAECVQEGQTLSTAFGYHKDYVDYLLISVIEAGQESGNLVEAFEALADYYQHQKELREKLKTSLLVPSVTFVFLFAIMLAIFIIVIPRFQSLFSLFNKTLPATTMTLFAVSTTMQSVDFWLIVAIFLGLVLVFVRLLRTPHFRPLLDRIILVLPVIGPMLVAYSLTLFLQTLAFLLRAGVHLVKAMHIARNVITNTALLSGVDQMIDMIESGKSLSSSFHECLANYKIIEDVESLFVVGEVTGQLAKSVERVAALYQQKTYTLLSRVARIVPMIMLILLGLFIALLMISLYLPLLSFAKLID
jgi:type II secretory pathway component PulF